jgi:hypothetical protein
MIATAKIYLIRSSENVRSSPTLGYSAISESCNWQGERLNSIFAAEV